MGSLVQLHRRSLPLDLEIITLLRVFFGGGLRVNNSNIAILLEICSRKVLNQ